MQSLMHHRKVGWQYFSDSGFNMYFFSLFLAPEGELSHLLVDLKPITLWALEDVKTSALIVSPEQEYGAGGEKKVPNGCFHV